MAFEVPISGGGLAVRAAPRGLRWRQLPGLLQIVVGIALVVPFVVLAVGAPWIAPHSPNAIDLANRLAPPAWGEGGSTAHLLGTDHLGRDMLSRIIYGARVSILIGGVTVLGAGILGVAIGLLAGYFRGPLDTAVTAIAEIQQSFPFLALAIVVIATIGRGMLNMIAVLVIGGWILFFRVVRGEAMSIAERRFVDGAKALGAGHRRIMLRHILPNVRASIIVIATFNFAWFITAEASLSFLGLGVDPSTPSWGQMLSDSRSYFQLAWWYPTFPGLALVALVLGANLLGDGLQNRWDPYLR
jgi:ABC-type dipeptide/oligopeptide/nickel transport system permease subunit